MLAFAKEVLKTWSEYDLFFKIIPRPLRFASDFLYSRDHYWVKAIKDDEVRVGLSDYGQDSTGDIITIDVEIIHLTFCEKLGK